MLHVERRHVNKFRIQNGRSIDAVAIVFGQRNAVSKTGKHRIDACLVIRQVEKALCRSRQTQAQKSENTCQSIFLHLTILFIGHRGLPAIEVKNLPVLDVSLQVIANVYGPRACRCAGKEQVARL